MLFVRCQVVTTVSFKMTVFWNIGRCILLEVGRRFRRAYCLKNQGDRGSTSQQAVIFILAAVGT
jgi:hypothetical protein